MKKLRGRHFLCILQLRGISKKHAKSDGRVVKNETTGLFWSIFANHWTAKVSKFIGRVFKNRVLGIHPFCLSLSSRAAGSGRGRLGAAGERPVGGAWGAAGGGRERPGTAGQLFTEVTVRIDLKGH